ncbi:hypothetical protein M409DRAFT_64408 [Zasmidium cellare ATCC 36951]|uniref:Methyltransferase n=1 Tax=Zasmidium cellare ATCC 36951 TaxID=1080233 RepID=A0A6A6CSH2_ZASCE|nr:uncharacterized protein M409DRAFT_64408 [Zasmidium cellare ATCC 36951]KAF2170025.1 hypothetical protein M409DRAFT_64408 [Zasmidium cellare ATCC 36951]
MYPFEDTKIQLSIRQAGFRRQTFNTQPAKVHDTRGHEDDFTLDTHGFQIIKDSSPFPASTFDSDDFINTTYADHITDLLKDSLGCSRVYILATKVREVTWKDAITADNDLPDTDMSAAQNGHIQFPHVDYSYDGAPLFVKRLASQPLPPDALISKTLPDEETMGIIQKHRWAMINYWQPIRNPVTRDALAVCDARTVPEDDLFEDPPEVIEKVKFFGTWYMKAPKNDEHKWYYYSDMRTDEALLIKCFDSKLDGRARRAPHTAFTGSKDHGPVRSSVEIRTLVCWEDEDVE